MNWLTRMEIDVDLRKKHKILDNYDWHQRLWECFPDNPKAPRDFLTRIDQQDQFSVLWMASVREPVCPTWCPTENFVPPKRISQSFFEHKRYAFDLVVNPTKKLPIRGEDGRCLRQGKRVALVKEDELRTWLERKGMQRCLDAHGEAVNGGFRLLPGHPLEISPMVEQYFRKSGHTGLHGGVRFRGVLEVTNTQAFIATYRHGLGSAKSYGFGLFLLAPLAD
jgi:CRISPR system Cascade subunit CasE